MEFGKVPVADLADIDFRLPADGACTVQRLNGNRSGSARAYAGGAKWGRKEWIDIIYPRGTREKDFLENYLKHFNGIELNATHYKTYSEAETARWAEKANGKEFMFCPKMLQSVTHYSDLSSYRARELTDKFLADLETAYETLATGNHISQDLQVRILLTTYRLVDENLKLRRVIDDMKNKMIMDSIRQSFGMTLKI